MNLEEAAQTFNKPYIQINGENHVKVSNCISDFYRSKVVHCDEGVSIIECNSEVENAICLSEDICEESLNELRNVYPEVEFDINDIEF